MAKLIIRREDRLINVFRKYRIMVNGNQLTTLSNKEMQELVLPEGDYRLQAKIDWAGSPELKFTLSDNSPLELEVGCNTGVSAPRLILSTLSFMLVIGLFWNYEHMPWQGWVVLIVLWLINDVILTKGKSFLYYLTKGRHDYLFIRNVKTS